MWIVGNWNPVVFYRLVRIFGVFEAIVTLTICPCVGQIEKVFSGLCEKYAFSVVNWCFVEFSGVHHKSLGSIGRISNNVSVFFAFLLSDLSLGVYIVWCLIINS
jgi:hypothetical protein